MVAEAAGCPLRSVLCQSLYKRPGAKESLRGRTTGGPRAQVQWVRASRSRGQLGEKRQDGPVSKLCHLNMERAKGEKVQSVKQPTVFKTDLNQEIGQDRCVLQRKESFGDTAKVEEGEVRGSPALWGHTEQGHADPFPQARVCKHTVQRLSQQ